MSSDISASANGNTTQTKSEPYGNFDFVTRVKPDYANVVIEKWRSRVSGLSVVHVDYEAPIVKGFFAVGTEIFDDSGCPHTLEHLIFLGSEKHPYKGVLDNLANRAFAQGTNAWTDQDQTVYTIDTAGHDGFLRLLPVYLDHLLWPTLTASGYVTEVHHINGEGEDAGVVYSEMQGRENTPNDLLALRLQRAFYPEGNAYRSETGGLMEALRNLDIHQIRKYHSTYYAPHNLCVIMMGRLSTKDLLNVLQSQVEPRIIAHGQAHGPRPPGWKRPFMETKTAEPFSLGKGKLETVEFPEQDESVGEACVSWIGPKADDFVNQQALDILGTYLTDSPVAPLTKAFVETASPLCTGVYISDSMRATITTLDMYMTAVPTELLSTIQGRVNEELQKIVAAGIDMERMGMILRRERRRLADSLETSTSDVFLSSVIDDFLYGDPDGKSLSDSLDNTRRYNMYEQWTNEDWCTLIQRYLLDAPSIVILSKPSGDLAKKIEETDLERIASQREKLGPEGLAQREKELAASIEANDKAIPSEMLSCFPLPDLSSVSWIPVQTAQNDPTKGGLYAPKPSDTERLLQSDATTLPYFVEFDHVKSNFVTVCAYLSTADLPNELRNYVPLHLSSFFSLPIIRDGVEVPYDKVVNHLDDLSAAYTIESLTQFSQFVRITLKVQPVQYDVAIGWLRDLMYNARFDVERLRINAIKMLQGLPALKRDGSVVLDSVHYSTLFNETSTAVASGLLTQMTFIPELVARLEEEPEEVVKDMEALRTAVTQPSVVRFAVYGDVLSLKEPRSAWAKNFRSLPLTKLTPISWIRESLSDLGRNPAKKGVVVTIPSIESSYSIHSTKSLPSWDHPDYAAMRVAVEVLEGMESFLWRYIRGAGLAYGVNILVDVEAGLLSFSLYRAPDSYKGFVEAAKVVKEVAEEKLFIEDTTMDAAKSTLVYNFASRMGTVGKAAVSSFSNQVLRGVSVDHHHELLQRYNGVTREEVLAAIRKYILPVFDPAHSVAVVVSSPNKAEEITAGLKSAGFDVESRKLDLELSDGESDFSDNSMSEDSR
ncbi:hypothetical protein DACRYDRAFT_21645 [Dacryopinax primogenitus]|uniref:Zinc metalloprotease n=1 Tax=Dacryopinax primogenitus (strain DJM 731) TaxID=1858805 RepID=M5G1H7_DACPD|nr:uncharacterized protein DACRYDRAFT_21645 [Dacryopinax primogenitus]EJU02584.1 hypothetical protein DACRYDRAFT_21645 [Dacryopinax primogenitus]